MYSFGRVGHWQTKSQGLANNPTSYSHGRLLLDRGGFVASCVFWKQCKKDDDGTCGTVRTWEYMSAVDENHCCFAPVPLNLDATGPGWWGPPSNQPSCWIYVVSMDARLLKCQVTRIAALPSDYSSEKCSFDIPLVRIRSHRKVSAHKLWYIYIIYIWSVHSI